MKRASATIMTTLSVRLTMITTTNIQINLIKQTKHFIETNSTSNTRVAPTQ